MPLWQNSLASRCDTSLQAHTHTRAPCAHARTRTHAHTTTTTTTHTTPIQHTHKQAKDVNNGIIWFWMNPRERKKSRILPDGENSDFDQQAVYKTRCPYCHRTSPGLPAESSFGVNNKQIFLLLDCSWCVSSVQFKVVYLCLLQRDRVKVILQEAF